MRSESHSKARTRHGDPLHLGSPRKKAKVHHSFTDALPWKTVVRPSEAGMGGDDGILELEEVDGVEVVYEEMPHGQVVRFNVSNEEPRQVVVSDEEETISEDDPAQSSPQLTDISQEDLELSESFDSKLPNWHPHALHLRLLRGLYIQSFTTPTPIQSQAIPFALSGKDIVGVAETGSGKTLAYGLPILHHLLSEPRKLSSKTKRRQLKALILAPTRELALQVSAHLKECLNPVSTSTVKEELADSSDNGTERKMSSKLKKPASIPGKRLPNENGPLVSIAAIVGGMSSQKQRRILDRGLDVLVATPGRLWDIMEEDDSLARQIKHIRFLVLDEADRMIETGHFAELDNILRLTLRQAPEDQIKADFNDSNSDKESKSGAEKGQEDALQTFVFSATLSKDLQRNLKRRVHPKGVSKNKEPASTLDDLLLRLDFRDPEPQVIDISPAGGVVDSLRESKVDCLGADKDVYLYYFLLRYPGRSLVFLSSIDGIRRLMPLMELLNLKAFPLHSQLEQRQRLKNLDRFKTIPNSILLATDIAARGLDIPSVDHVIHFQIPRSADTYVHRNGRTARAMRNGFSMLMCAPDERRIVKGLLGSLGRKESDIPEMSIELDLLDKLKTRVALARKIDNSQHKVKKENHEKNWMKEAAEAMEIELDSDFASDLDEAKPSNHKRLAQSAKTSALKAELKHMISQPLLARGVSARYITSGSRPIADDLIAGEYNKMMLGTRKSEARHDLVPSKKAGVLKVEVESEEEWGGIDCSDSAPSL